MHAGMCLMQLDENIEDLLKILTQREDKRTFRKVLKGSNAFTGLRVEDTACLWCHQCHSQTLCLLYTDTPITWSPHRLLKIKFPK